MKVKVTGKMAIGSSSFLAEVVTNSDAEMHEAMALFGRYPKVGPNGETDLVVTYKNTAEGYEYYSVVSKKAGKEFMFGQSKKEPGKLFSKSWQDLYKPTDTPKPAQTAPPKEEAVPEVSEEVDDVLSEFGF